MTLQDIVEKIREECGFEVYIHAAHRTELNDYPENPDPTGDYVRAIHNIRDPERKRGSIVSAVSNWKGKAGLIPKDDVGYSEVRYGALSDNSKIPLSDIVNTNDSGDAHFLRLTILASIPDSIGRHGQLPQVVIVGNKKIIEESVGYIKDNPKKYIEFIKAILPADEFPKVNKGIIEKGKATRYINIKNVDTGKMEIAINEDVEDIEDLQ